MLSAGIAEQVHLTRLIIFRKRAVQQTVDIKGFVISLRRQRRKTIPTYVRVRELGTLLVVTEDIA